MFFTKRRADAAGRRENISFIHPMQEFAFDWSHAQASGGSSEFVGRPAVPGGFGRQVTGDLPSHGAESPQGETQPVRTSGNARIRRESQRPQPSRARYSFALKSGLRDRVWHFRHTSWAAFPACTLAVAG